MGCKYQLSHPMGPHPSPPMGPHPAGPMGCKYQLSLRACAVSALLDSPTLRGVPPPPPATLWAAAAAAADASNAPLTTHGNKYASRACSDDVAPR
jgi:hypothetical protein